MIGTLMRLLMLCGGLAMVAPVVVAQDECGEDECADSAGASAQDEASDWSDDADSEETLEQEDDPGCAAGACETGDELSDQDNGLDPDSEDSGAQASEEEQDDEEEQDSGADGATPTADVPAPAAAENPSAPAPAQAPEAVTSAQGAVSEVTDDSFVTLVVQSSVPVLVFFWAEWCGPCRMVAPTLDQLAVDYAGRARIVSLNVDESPDIVFRFGVRNAPVFLLFKGGDVAERTSGAAPKSALASLIDRNL